MRARLAAGSERAGELLGAVEVAERHVVEAARGPRRLRPAEVGEHAGGDGIHSAHADIPLGVAGPTADDEGMGHQQAGQAGAPATAQARQVRRDESQGC
ncbi:Uncharacterised protein [Actinomyces denticolens]|nr:Uncharacterised protein [Actinomyces denticolens]